MRISGTAVLTLPQSQVWHLLTTPQHVGACLPHLEAWTAVSTLDTYQLDFAWPLGSQQVAIPATVTWREQQPPDSFAFVAQARWHSALVQVEANATLSAAAPHSTQVAFTAVFTTPNPILTQLIQTHIPRQIDTFFSCLQQQHTSPQT